MKAKNWFPKKIEDYLEKYYGNVGTRDTCRAYLKSYFTALNEEPNKYLRKNPDEIKQDLWNYTKLIENKPKKTQSAMLSVIKKYLNRNDIPIKDREWEDIRIRNNLVRGNRPITKKETPTAYDLKKVLSYADIKAKSLFVFCATTGLRIDEALSLNFNDINLEKRKVELLGDIAKFDIPRYTFFTPEAKELIKLWLPEREKQLQVRYRKSKFLREKLKKEGYEIKKVKFGTSKKQDYFIYKIFKHGKELTKKEVINLDNRIWPFNYSNAQKMWTSLLEKAGEPYNIRDTNPKLQQEKYVYNVHCLRRFWFTQLSTSRANVEFVNFMGGHISELDSSYKKYESEHMKQQLKKEYDEHMNYLYIFESQPDLTETNKQIQELMIDNQRLKEELSAMRAEITEIRLARLEKANGIKK